MKKNIQTLLQTAWKIDEDIREYKSYDVAKAFGEVERRQKPLDSQSHTRLRLYLVAASLLLLLIPSSIMSFLYIRQYCSEEAPTYLTVTAAPGIISRFTLPDNSNVWLNAGSELRYPIRFIGKERKVCLKGEGYFEVESSREKPFIVSLGDQLQVKAYGTQFNIKSYTDEPFIEATLERGRIDMIYQNHATPLFPGENILFDKTKKNSFVHKVNIMDKIGWKDGVLIFRRHSLEEVIRTLSRRYNVDIILHKGDHPQPNFNFRATFTTETITQILDYMKMAAPIQWSFAKAEQRKDSSFTRQRIDIWLK